MRCGSCAGIAQLVVSSWKARHNTDAARVPSAAVFSSSASQLPMQTLLDSYGIRTALMCSCVHQHPGICSGKSQTLATMWYILYIILYYVLFGHTKILHTLRGIGSTAVLQLLWPKCPTRGKEVQILKEIECKKKKKVCATDAYWQTDFNQTSLGTVSNSQVKGNLGETFERWGGVNIFCVCLFVA